MTHLTLLSLAPLQLLRGDLTLQSADALVNAANAELAGGGGLDGAMHRAAGGSVMRELMARYPQGCPTGSAVITGPGFLARQGVKHIIHAVGPMWFDGERGERTDLASAYRTSLQLARDHGCKTVAFPSISTGIFEFPLDLAAPIALGTVAGFLKEEPIFSTVTFVLFDDRTFAAYQAALSALRVHP